MKKIVIASVMPKAGKTTVALGIAKKMSGNIGYMKPLGDNQIYKKKRLVDYDAALFKEVFSIEEPIDDFTLGFHHSKILHAFPDVGKELEERYNKLSSDKDFFIIEGSEDLVHGNSLGLDSFSVASKLDAGVLLVLSGDMYDMADSLSFADWIARNKKIDIVGAVIDKWREENTQKIGKELEKRNIPLLGFVPYIDELDMMKVRYVADKLFARVVAGEGGLDNQIKNILIAALSVPEILRHPDFKKEHKLIITGGDRTDVIAASLNDENTSCVILTNNIVPPSNILAKADKSNIPLLSIRPNTYIAAKKVEDIESIILPDEKEKINKIQKATEKLDISVLMG
ncbi:MAG: AAA family ATPase [Candidatus Thermoplasmatota archaeon]|nr:AAA family ATPase [Candidatus Thermoplasmatota archaeon]